jgi:hypothetical protein
MCYTYILEHTHTHTQEDTAEIPCITHTYYVLHIHTNLCVLISHILHTQKHTHTHTHTHTTETLFLGFEFAFNFSLPPPPPSFIGIIVVIWEEKLKANSPMRKRKKAPRKKKTKEKAPRRYKQAPVSCKHKIWDSKKEGFSIGCDVYKKKNRNRPKNILKKR